MSSAVEEQGPPVPREELREASFGELISSLASDTSLLVKQEIQLAKVELTAKGKLIGKALATLVAAAVFGLLALIVLSVFLIIVLDAFLELWLAALIVLVLWAVIAAVLASKGKKELDRATPVVPEATVETVKEDVKWAKNPTQPVQR